MTINNDLFTNPPLDFNIPNEGVTNVNRPTGDKQWHVLNYELRRFVCEGEYEQGLERILESYLAHRDKSTQPAAWVSGFYGSGKSHLIRVLQHLWADTEFPDGATACGLVDVTQGIRDQLKALSTQAARDGAPLWAAAGALDRNADSLNEVFLATVLQAAELPTHVNSARVALWLHHEGALDAVKTEVANAGMDFIREIGQYHLSQHLAAAIHTALPEFSDSPRKVREALTSQFPPEDDPLSTRDTMSLFQEVLQYVGGGVIPPTLIVLDEVQEYITSVDGREGEVRSLAEALQQGFDGRVLLVATGQQEMTANPTLQKIQDRFTVKVVLRNQDVDTVVRRVLLDKKPSEKERLGTALDDASGEISRQLANTRIEQTSGDQADLVSDYPLLPSRRRFWEEVLRQVDAGRAGQLRTQLRVVHEANRSVAERPLNTVIGADYLYDAKHDDLNAAALLLKDTQRVIEEQRQSDPLRGRVLGLIHLISLLPTTGHADIGVRASPVCQAELSPVVHCKSVVDGAEMREIDSR